MMVANRLKNLAQLTRGAVRDVRQVVNELAEVLAPRRQPSLVRIPVRSGSQARQRASLRSPYTSARHFSSSSQQYAARPTFRPTFIKGPIRGGLANQLWPYSAFRKSLLGSSPFPSGLYRNFVNHNARNFSSYGGSASREAVQNLTSSLRCMFNNGGDTVMSMKMTKSHSSPLTYHGAMNQKEAPETFKLARCESTGIEKLGSYVEFSLPKLELTIPSVSFMSSEIMGSIEEELDMLKKQIDRTSTNIQMVFDAYGSLPLERRDRSVRIHFPNLDADELERFLVELGIEDGLVYTSEDVNGMVSAESNGTSDSDLCSSTDLSDFLEDHVPDLLSSDSESDSSSSSSIDFFHALSDSTADEYHRVAPGDISRHSTPVMIAHSERSFSDVSMI